MYPVALEVAEVLEAARAGSVERVLVQAVVAALPAWAVLVVAAVAAVEVSAAGAAVVVVVAAVVVAVVVVAAVAEGGSELWKATKK